MTKYFKGLYNVIQFESLTIGTKSQKMTHRKMARKIIDTNPHLRTKKKRIEKVARSQSASHKIEGINISPSKIKRMLRDKNGSTRKK